MMHSQKTTVSSLKREGEEKMPNIEIHGLHGLPAEELRGKIFRILANSPIYCDMVITVQEDNVAGPVGDSQPFLRIFSTSDEEQGIIVETLYSSDVNMDMELMPPIKFIPRKTTS